MPESHHPCTTSAPQPHACMYANVRGKVHAHADGTWESWMQRAPRAQPRPACALEDKTREDARASACIYIFSKFNMTLQHTHTHSNTRSTRSNGTRCSLGPPFHPGCPSLSCSRRSRSGARTGVWCTPARRATCAPRATSVRITARPHARHWPAARHNNNETKRAVLQARIG